MAHEQLAATSAAGPASRACSTGGCSSGRRSTVRRRTRPAPSTSPPPTARPIDLGRVFRAGRLRRGDGRLPAAHRLPPHRRAVHRGRDGGGVRRHGPGRAALLPGDGRSWWAELARRHGRVGAHAGLRRGVAGGRRPRGRRATPAPRRPVRRRPHVGPAQPTTAIEALFKPIGVAAGISDVPWHKDCSLGRHSYECCSMNVGISVTGAGRDVRSAAGRRRIAPGPRLAGAGRAADVRPARGRPADRHRRHHDPPVVHAAHGPAAGRPDPAGDVHRVRTAPARSPSSPARRAPGSAGPARWRRSRRRSPPRI